MQKESKDDEIERKNAVAHERKIVVTSVKPGQLWIVKLDEQADEIFVMMQLQEWWKCHLSQKDNIFTQCYGVWHHSECGHRARVLCDSCSDNWESCKVGPCLQSITTRMDECLGSAHGQLLYFFQKPCMNCPNSQLDRIVSKDSRKERDLHAVWKQPNSISHHVEEFGWREISQGDMERDFYILGWDCFNFLEITRESHGRERHRKENRW